MGMSFVLASTAFAVAAYEWKQFKCRQYSFGIAYWGLMEMLQCFQHVWAAEENDNYAMCGNTINQLLTEIGGIHVVFQPLFNCMLMMSLYRRFDIQARIQADLIYNMCLLAGIWFSLSPIMDLLVREEEFLATPATPESPNWDWLQEGYDGRLGKSTPNIPGYSCTYYAPTNTGHLAWVLPMHPGSYFWPGTSLHMFLMIAPYLAMGLRIPFFPMAAVALFFTGPILARTLTPSANEQAAIWCLYSIVQVVLFVFYVRHVKLYQQPVQNELVVPGGRGEETLTYVRVMPNGQIYNHQNNGNNNGVDMVKPFLDKQEEEKKT